MTRSIAAVGDVADLRSWSGIPFHFRQAAQAAGFADEPWRVDLGRVTWQRWVWNATQALSGGGRGFQYSKWFLRLIEGQIPEALWSSEIITFNQHFPRASSVRRKGGLLYHYLDAPFAALATGRGLDLRLPPRIVAHACQLERENFAGSQRVIFMARWAAEFARQECGVPATKVHVILPGANLTLPPDWSFPRPESRPGRERPFTLGFVGKDWRRKGLPLVLKVRDELVRRGWMTQIMAAGDAPAELQRADGVKFVGYIDKQKDSGAFLRFLSACDLGCLFSEREAFGISTLEFLRAGVPVAGFAHEGQADALPPDAGFRFATGASIEHIADVLEGYLQDEGRQARFRANAQRWSPLVTWERCIGEFQELWERGTMEKPVQPWLGLPSLPSEQNQ